MEKLLKCWIVLANQEPPRSHDLVELAAIAEVDLSDTLLALQPFAVEARYRDGEFPLPARRELILSSLNELVRAFLDAAECAKDRPMNSLGQLRQLRHQRWLAQLRQGLERGSGGNK